MTVAHRLDRLFRPQSVAVVGASPKGGYGLTTLDNMRGVGFEGSLYVVHPTLDEVGGVAAFPSLNSLPSVPDAIAVAVPAKAVPGILAEAAGLGVGGAVVYASGFAELGSAGGALQQEVINACADRLPVVGPNCLGLASYRGRSSLWGITLPFVHASVEGTVALAAQSGNMSLTTMLSGRLPGVAYGASLGNQALVDVTDCLEYYLQDTQVRVVALIIEGLKDLGRFRKLALDAAASNVAIVALKVGRSAKGEAATVTHTGTLAGQDAAYDALFRQTGVVRVDDIDEMVAVCALLSSPRQLKGTSLGVFASSGGECGLVADLAEDNGVAIAEFDDATKTTLRSVLPDYGYISNPFDLTAGGWGQADVYQTTTAAMASCPDVDVVAFVGDSPTYSGSLEESGWPAMIEGAGQAAVAGDVPVALITTTTDTNIDLPALCERHGVTFLAGVRPALRAISLVGGRNRQISSLGDHGVDPAGSDADVRHQAKSLLAGHSGTLSESVSKSLLSLYGIATPVGGSASDADAAIGLAEEIGFPVVCKLEADELAHKSDIGGVVVGLAEVESLRTAVEQVMARGIEAMGADAVRGVRIEQAADTSRGIELIVGGCNDASGSLVVLGAGGVLTELLADAGTLLWPFTSADVHRVLDSLRIRPLLDGYRGNRATDLAPIVEAALEVGRLLSQLPEIAEIDINPLLCGAAGSNTVALDALVRLNATTADHHTAITTQIGPN